MTEIHDITIALNGKAVDVEIEYHMVGYKPLIYGVFHNGDDVTMELSEQAFDRIYAELMTKALGA